MSILFINRVYPPSSGATGRILKEIQTELQTKGETVNVSYIPKESKRVVSLLKLLFKSCFISRKNYDTVVLMTDPPFLLLAAPILKLKRIKVILWSQDVFPDLFYVFDTPILQHNFFKKINKFLLKFPDHIIVIGRDMKTIMQEEYKVPNDKISTIYNWADKVISPIKVKKDKFTIMYSGNCGEAYNFDIIIEMAKQLKDEEIKFKLICQGKQKTNLEQQIKDNELSNISISNYVNINEYNKSVNSADLHMISTKKETKGLMVPCKSYSALAAGIPLIYYGDKESEISLLINEYDCGFTSENKDELANSILTFYKDNNILQEKGKNALKINQEFGLEKAAEKFKEVINKCTANN